MSNGLKSFEHLLKRAIRIIAAKFGRNPRSPLKQLFRTRHVLCRTTDIQRSQKLTLSIIGTLETEHLQYPALSASVQKIENYHLDKCGRLRPSPHAHSLYINPYKPSVLFIGHRQTVQTQIRHHRTRRLIRVSTVCSQNVILEFE